jgi:hypothetical protein
MNKVRLLKEQTNGYWMKSNPLVIFLDESGSKYYFESTMKYNKENSTPLYYDVDVYIENDETALFFAIKYGIPE